ncbi:hypothetical protein [Allostreptomyces psammosilenae]|uniref:Uncharacterized protein n=1 Tax=Allostreptomyces psammosilenae TaxID=1892865 RepID=A0A853A2B5_9ACTN|nr:hypothetical protein [Allostreptomyces psammosilenae]NYI08257.1 hypothetical protein [Allostreptomyces psammosilenae]
MDKGVLAQRAVSLSSDYLSGDRAGVAAGSVHSLVAQRLQRTGYGAEVYHLLAEQPGNPLRRRAAVELTCECVEDDPEFAFALELAVRQAAALSTVAARRLGAAAGEGAPPPGHGPRPRRRARTWGLLAVLLILGGSVVGSLVLSLSV